MGKGGDNNLKNYFLNISFPNENFSGNILKILRSDTFLNLKVHLKVLTQALYKKICTYVEQRDVSKKQKNLQKSEIKINSKISEIENIFQNLRKSEIKISKHLLCRAKYFIYTKGIY